MPLPTYGGNHIMKIKLIAFSLVFLFSLSLVSMVPITTVYTPIALESPVMSDTSMLADGEEEYLVVPIFEEEAVISEHPDINYDYNTHRGGLFVGHEWTDGMARSWLKFNLANLPEGVVPIEAVLAAYMNDDFNATVDAPIGVHYSSNDTWTETDITWNNQPSFNPTATDVYGDAPASDLFVEGNWYEWDVTGDVATALEGDRMLTEVLVVDNEGGLNETWQYFTEYEYDVVNSTQLRIRYTVPGITDPTVDGHSQGSVLTDYIQSACPEFGWTPTDLDTDDFQRSYEVQIWDNMYFNDTFVWHGDNTYTSIIYSGGASDNARPFATADEFRFQFKYEDTLLSRPGVVDKLYFEVEEDGVAVFEDLSIYMTQTDVAGDLTADFDANYGDGRLVQVLERPVYEAVTENQWLVFDIEDLFVLNVDQHLIIEFRFTNNTGDELRSLLAFAMGGSVAYTYGDGASHADTAVHLYARTHNLKLDMTTTVTQVSTSSANWFPFGTDIGEDGIFQLKYNQSKINNDGVIDRLYFRVSQATGDVVYENLRINIAEVPDTFELTGIVENNVIGLELTEVLNAPIYTVRNLGHTLVIDLDNVFEYSNTQDLFIQFEWDALVSGHVSVEYTGSAGGYRAWNVSFGSQLNGTSYSTYDMYLEFIHPEPVATFDGCIPLVNGTQYFFRVRLSDTTGIWTQWTTGDFKYEVLTSTPDFEAPTNSPDPAIVDSSVTVSIDVTYFLGINEVSIEIDGVNHTMTASGDTYSYEFTPTSVGNVSYTIYMESAISTWSNTTGIFEVVQGSFIPGLDNTTLILIAAGVVFLIIIIVIVRKRKK